MKTQWMLTLLLAGALTESLTVVAAAQQGANTRSMNAVHQRSTHTSARTISKGSDSRPNEATQAKADPAKLSPGFELSALNTVTRMQVAERRIANAIKTSLPLGEYWIQTDLDAIDESLRLAAGSTRNDADLQALRQLEEQSDRLRTWTGWLVDQNRQLRLANYYVTPAALDNDERFQNVVSCTRSLMSMLASGKVAESNPCA